MSITNELRKWVMENVTNNVLTCYPPKHEVCGTKEGLLAIADRIDAEHENATSRAGQLLADAEKDRDYNYANWQECKQKVLQGNITFDELNAKIECLEDELLHCIELPKDADGEYIHIGDVMASKDGKVHKVNSLTRNPIWFDYEWSVGLTLLNDVFGVGSLVRYRPDTLRHYHTPTVEDVLREFAAEFNRDDSELCDEEIIERFATKLRLAGDAE